MTAVIKGRAFPPQQSRPLEAELRFSDGSAEVVDQAGVLIGECRASELRFDAPIGRAPRRATLPDGTLFETDDHTAVEALSGGSAGSTLHRFEAFHPRLVVVLAGCIAGIWLIWRYGLDVMASIAVAMTPAPIISAIDAGVLQSIDYAIAEPSKISPEDQAEAEAVFARLIASLDPHIRDTYAFRLEFRQLPGLGPNAVALPNGTIIITDELLKIFASEDVRAGVLGHEIGHVVESHGLRQLYRSVGVAVLIALLAGDTGPIVEDVVLEGNVLLSLSFSRRHESAADAFGVGLTRRAGFDPDGLIQFFDYVADTYGDDADWLSTHPSSSDRIEQIRRLIQAGD